MFYVPWFNSDGPLMSKVSHFQIDFQALNPKFVMALEPKLLKLDGLSFGTRPSIYVLKGCPDAESFFLIRCVTKG